MLCQQCWPAGLPTDRRSLHPALTSPLRPYRRGARSPRRRKASACQSARHRSSSSASGRRTRRARALGNPGLHSGALQHGTEQESAPINKATSFERLAPSPAPCLVMPAHAVLECSFFVVAEELKSTKSLDSPGRPGPAFGCIGTRRSFYSVSSVIGRVGPPCLPQALRVAI